MKALYCMGMFIIYAWSGIVPWYQKLFCKCAVGEVNTNSAITVKLKCVHLK